MKLIRNRCSTIDCPHPPAFLPEIRIWAAGYPKATTPPLTYKMGLPFCAECAKAGELQWIGVNTDVARQLLAAADVPAAALTEDRGHD